MEHHPEKTALLITRNLPPLVGGMERLVWHIADALAQQYRLHVIGPVGCAAHMPAGVSSNEIPIKPLWHFLWRVTWAAIIQAFRRKPSVVFAGSGLTAPFVWLAARLTGAKCVVYLHGLDIETQHPVYRLLWRPFFKRFDLVFVNSHFTQGLALGAGVSAERIRLLHPGVQLPAMDTANAQRQAFRQHHHLGSRPVLLYVGRITARKGLLPFIRDIFPTILAERPDTQLLVIGDEPTHALHQADSPRQKITEALLSQDNAHRVSFLSKQDDKQLSQAYFAADVHIFPVQETPGDYEGFGMVAIEAAAHGLPTVVFNVGGVADAVADGVSGRLIPAGDNAAFARAVHQLIENPIGSAHPRQFAARFAWHEFDTQLHQ